MTGTEILVACGLTATLLLVLVLPTYLQEKEQEVVPTSVLCVDAAEQVRAYILCKQDFNCPLTHEQYVDYIHTFDYGREYCANEREAGKVFTTDAGDQETYTR